MVSKLPSMVVSAVTTFDGKALAKGGKEITAFEKGAKKLGATFAAAFSVQQIVNFGKNAVKAFADNEKSAKRLATVVKNLGLAFETPMIEKSLDDISAKYGYQGEVLREAFQKLITVTGSAAKSQDLLNLSLDVAAGSGQDLLTVNQDLAALYVGNTKGLKKYNLGLTQAELSTIKYEDAVALLAKTFKGSASEELTTFSGKMRVLSEAAGNAQEIIGTSLVDSLSLLAGEGNSIQPLADAMGDFATYIGDAIYGVAVLAEKLKNLPGAGLIDKAGGAKNILKFLPQIGPVVQLLDALAGVGKEAKGKAGMGGYPSSALGGTYVDPNEAKRKKAEAEAEKRRRQMAADAAKQAKAEKQKIALTKAAAVFDSTRISLAAALKATYDKETKLRLEALMLIEEDKGEAALKKIDELAKFQKNADMQRLAGVEEISSATLESLNKQLLTELRVVNESKMAEGDKELAREEAFKKYNAAITAAGTLAAKESYSERVQIQLTEIARLASISKTSNAATTATLLLESSELSMIDRVAKAQAAADAARMKSLNDYNNALNRTGLDYGGNKLGSLVPNFVPPEWTLPNYGLGGSRSDSAASIALMDQAATANYVPASNNTTVQVTVNAGIGDPEAIARAIEDTLNQSTYRGTSTGRGTGNYIL
ncbi:hypothetical protein UFOVP720_24 [uncultured Caudovirales phage]|uniref:Uncharacterized protein n=1 Tax=uncultured Caudovirales phage TaxID=2100421 RepID=A0A6J5NRC3_9CAUD|nr:hypothetical protein UFOVP720_24 [uncultured Caudovirales phage]